MANILFDIGQGTAWYTTINRFAASIAALYVKIVLWLLGNYLKLVLRIMLLFIFFKHHFT
jgi:hypothetical protein